MIGNGLTRTGQKEKWGGGYRENGREKGGVGEEREGGAERRGRASSVSMPKSHKEIKYKKYKNKIKRNKEKKRRKEKRKKKKKNLLRLSVSHFSVLDPRRFGNKLRFRARSYLLPSSLCSDYGKGAPLFSAVGVPRL